MIMDTKFTKYDYGHKNSQNMIMDTKIPAAVAIISHDFSNLEDYST